MKVYPNIFSNNPVDRVSDLRSDPEWVKKTLKSDKTMIALFWRGKAFVSTVRNLISGHADADQLSPAWFPLDFFKNQLTDWFKRVHGPTELILSRFRPVPLSFSFCILLTNFFHNIFQIFL